MKTNAFSSLGLPDGLGSTVRIIGEVLLGVLNVVGVLDGVLNKKSSRPNSQLKPYLLV